MFGLLDSFKYRSRVIAHVHEILRYLPALDLTLKMLPSRNAAINDARKAKVRELEIAVGLSLAVIEHFMPDVPQEGRSRVLQQLEQSSNDSFSWFAETPKLLADKTLFPIKVPLLTFVLGFACFYLGQACRENRLSEGIYKMFIVEVANMLLGKSAEQRRTEWLDNLLEDVLSHVPGSEESAPGDQAHKGLQ